MEPLDVTRRGLLRGAMAGLSWLTPVAHLLAGAAEKRSPREPAQSLILLWLAGGPSQLETFDPHPNTAIAGGTKAIRTALPEVYLAEHYPRLAEALESVTLVRNVVSKEGDHERGAYTLKTGYRPDPTVVHPSIGAICCHQLPVGGTEIPRHVSILPDRWPGRGGMLGNQYDAFKAYDPKDRLPDVAPRVSKDRAAARAADQAVVEAAFAAGRRQSVQATMHADLIQRARAMMASAQLQAFEVLQEPSELLAAYGDTAFGRGCLAARRLIQVGVRCVEVTLAGWDTHLNNHEGHRQQAQVLDPALATLLRDLREHDLLDKTIVMCGGEFGRTPKINKADGRDHWPHGFSFLLAGGRLRRGYVHGATDPQGEKLDLTAGTPVADLHATVLAALGIDPHHEVLAPVGRPIRLSEGEPVVALLA